MWKDLLEKIKDEMKIYDEELNNGATESEIIKFVSEVKRTLNRDIPREYLEVLKVVNGFEYGVTLYGIDENLLKNKPKQHINGFIDSNQIWSESDDQEQYLYIAENDITWYVYSYEDKAYMELDKPSGSKCDSFSSFEEMLENILENALM